MPVITISSRSDYPALKISDFAQELCRLGDIQPSHLTICWHPAPAEQIFHQGSAVNEQPENLCIVDLLLPEFCQQQKIERILALLARLLANYCQCPEERIFINCRLAQSDMVFDSGHIQRWS